MNRFVSFYYRAWRPALLALVVAGLAYLLFYHNLGGLVDGYSTREVANFKASDSMHTIVSNPVNAPYKLITWSLLHINHHQIVMLRVSAASFAVLASIVFFFVARSWFSYRVALLTTIIFATSSGFLHIARLGSPQILQMSLLVLMASIVWIRRTNCSKWSYYITLLLFTILLYIPGMIWFEFALIAILSRQLRQKLQRQQSIEIVVSAGIVLLAIFPLVRSIILQPTLVLTALGMPEHFQSPVATLQTLADSFLSIGIKSYGSADLWLGNVPLLNIAEIALLIIGGFTFIQQYRSRRSLFLAIAIVLSIILIGVKGPVSVSSLIPLLYLVIGAGLHSFLNRWFIVFPRNPIAKAGGGLVIGVVLFFSVLYHVRAYFIAWPHTTATKQAMHLQQPL